MKYTLLTAVASALLMAACSDSNPSSASIADNASNNDPNSTTGTLYIDESQHLMVTTFSNVHGNRCDLENNNLIWKTVTKNAVIDSSVYEFIGDTLVLYDYYEGGADNYGKLYVGGKAGNIYGSWVYTGIGRNRKTGEQERSTNTRYETRTYTYAPGKVTISVEYHMDLYVADEQERGYMESSFMVELYDYLARRATWMMSSILWTIKTKPAASPKALKKTAFKLSKAPRQTKPSKLAKRHTP